MLQLTIEIDEINRDSILHYTVDLYLKLLQVFSSVLAQSKNRALKSNQISLIWKQLKRKEFLSQQHQIDHWHFHLFILFNHESFYLNRNRWGYSKVRQANRYRRTKKTRVQVDGTEACSIHPLMSRKDTDVWLSDLKQSVRMSVSKSEVVMQLYSIILGSLLPVVNHRFYFILVFIVSSFYQTLVSEVWVRF